MEVILKTVERCNINCTYCYFFNAGDMSYQAHPIYIPSRVISDTASFLKKGCESCHVESIQIDFHGGEPLMQKKHKFDAMCQHFRDIIGPVTQLEFALQTNGMLIDDDWIELFHKHNVSIGVSLDGPKSVNDIARLDHLNRSTYERVITGLHKLQRAAEKQFIPPPSVLCVINPAYSAREIYRHFIDVLNVRSLDFLLPDLTHDTFNFHYKKTNLNVDDYGEYLCELFSEWTQDNNAEIDVRILFSALASIMGYESHLFGFGPETTNFMAFTISSNGDIAPDDTLRSASPTLMQTNMNVNKNSLIEFINHPIMQMLNRSLNKLSTGCQNCRLKKICGGGFLVHRYHHTNGFNNPSVMCNALKMLYDKVNQYALYYNAAINF